MVFLLLLCLNLLNIILTSVEIMEIKAIDLNERLMKKSLSKLENLPDFLQNFQNFFKIDTRILINSL